MAVLGHSSVTTLFCPRAGLWCGLLMELSSLGASGRVYCCVYWGCMEWEVDALHGVEAIWDILSCLLGQVECWHPECLSHVGTVPTKCMQTARALCEAG